MLKTSYSLIAITTAFFVAAGFFSMCTSREPDFALTISHTGKIKPAESKTVYIPESSQQSTDENAAWAVFAAITKDTPSNPSVPVFVGWDDKCDVGLTKGCSSEVFNEKVKSPNLPTDLRGLRLAQQFALSVAPNSSSPVHNGTPDGPSQLASVRFNPAAAEYVKQHGTQTYLDKIVNATSATPGQTTDLRLPRPVAPHQASIENNPMIAKLIWEIVPDSDPVVYIYDDTQKQMAEDGTELKSPVKWKTAYQLDMTPGECTGDLPDANGKNHISISCFHSIQVDLTDPNVRAQLKADQPNVPVGSLFSHGKAHAVLVGLHVMELTQDHPSWIWMTFYWSKHGHAPESLNSKWQHFQTSTTTTDGEDDTTIHQQKCANPYLEGNLDRNGISTNCMSCHSLASYQKQMSDAHVNAAQNYATDLQTLSFPASVQKAVKDSYFAQSVRTNFIWSIATDKIPPTP